MAYLLDANTFMEAKNGYYHFDVCPGFWEWIMVKHGEGSVFSIEKVGQELKEGTDELSTWAVGTAGALFLPPDEKVVAALKQVAAWVMGRSYDEKNRAAFLAKADALLVACALAHNHVVVTQEVKVPEESRKVKVPNVCEGLGVKWIHSFALLRDEKARFILEKAT